jgi:hypothetical protein
MKVRLAMNANERGRTGIVSNAWRVVAAGRLAALIALMCAGIAPSVHGEVIVNAVETGGDVVFTGSGSLDFGAWSSNQNTNAFGLINPTRSIVVGPTPAVDSDIYFTPTDFTGPSQFGTGSETFADSGSGDIFGLGFISSSRSLWVPDTYVSGNSLSGSSTYSSETFASLGIDLGSYTWSWGSGGTADSFTLNAVPEPSAVASLLSMGIVGLIGFWWRRRKAA